MSIIVYTLVSSPLRSDVRIADNQKFQLEKPHLYEPFLIDGKPVHPPLSAFLSFPVNPPTHQLFKPKPSEHGICVGAFLPGDPISKPFFATPFTTPFLHIYGQRDVVVVEEETRKVMDLNDSSSKRVLAHIGGVWVLYHQTALSLIFAIPGHFVPVSRRWRQFFVEYIRTWSKDTGSVSPLPSSSDSLDVLSTGILNSVPSH